MRTVLPPATVAMTSVAVLYDASDAILALRGDVADDEPRSKFVISLASLAEVAMTRVADLVAEGSRDP